MLSLENFNEVLVISAILYWLRSTIDQQKGAILEGLAVILPIGMHALTLIMQDTTVNLLELGFVLTPSVVFVFLSLPALAGVRFCERLWRGEQPQLADIFRLTTFTAMGTFTVNLLRIDQRAIYFVSIMTLAYLMGELVLKIPRISRRISMYVAVGLILMVIDVIVRNWNSFMPPSWQMQSPQRYVDLVMELKLQVLLALLIAPLVWHRLFDHNPLIQRLGYWVQLLRHRYVRPADATSQRTLFKLWNFREGVCYLNHGSFGAVPDLVVRTQLAWQRYCTSEPMDVLARHTEAAWRKSRDRLAFWLGTQPENLALCENSTQAMNELAGWFPLAAGDEVLLTNHEYGAVKRIWQRRCDESSASLKYVQLPLNCEEPQQIVDAILAACTTQTRLVVFSHITSPTAILLPVNALCQALREREIASCVDGPHALLQEPIHLQRMDCDFYTASCHKWLCAPLGSGLIYVHPRWHEQVKPLRLSWGILPPGEPKRWTDELTWVGTRDYSPYMAIAHAIDYFTRFDRKWLDARHHGLACYARRVLSESMGTDPLTPESREWFGWMVGVWLPTTGPLAGEYSQLQKRLWERYRIEVPIMRFEDRYLVRVSCHLYNTTHDIDLLARALVTELQRSSS